MSLRIGDIAPDFEAQTTQGTIRFHEWIGSGWAILFSHPKDFTPVCTTELGALAGLVDMFAERHCKILGLSLDAVEDHVAWLLDIEELFQGQSIDFPLVGDPDLEIARLYDLLPGDASGRASLRTPTDNASARVTFLIGPDKTIRAMLTYPMTTGRNLREILRLLDSCQLTEREQVATPVNWEKGEDVFILPTVSDEQATERYPYGWEEPLPYIRVVPEPGAYRRPEHRWRWI